MKAITPRERLHFFYHNARASLAVTIGDTKGLARAVAGMEKIASRGSLAPLDEANLMLNRAELALLQGQFDEAVEFAGQALARQPGTPAFVTAHAVIRLRCRRNEEEGHGAVATLERQIKDNPRDAGLHAKIAELEKLAAEPQAAAE